MSQMPCDATLRHAHGVAYCELPSKHEGRHEGECDRNECGLSTLVWTKHREVWPI